MLTPEHTVLITGGARGITAEVAIELARRYKPNLVLVGRSCLPSETEALETVNLKEPADIKAFIISRIKQAGAPIVHAEVEGTYLRLLQDREIRRTLAKIKKAGSQVTYYQLDVRDSNKFTACIKEVQTRFGGIDGVIHGAGVIEDRYLRDKTPESFDRVFGTKVDSALTLSQHLQADRLKFCVFFASIASRYGNTGQSDYAAANEVLSKLAISLDKKWQARVFSVAWGPWSSVGMVADLEKHLTARGLRLITPEEGSSLLIDELIHGNKGECEVILGGGAEHIVRPTFQKIPATLETKA